jgi:hypothetical protein
VASHQWLDQCYYLTLRVAVATLAGTLEGPAFNFWLNLCHFHFWIYFRTLNFRTQIWHGEEGKGSFLNRNSTYRSKQRNN